MDLKVSEGVLTCAISVLRSWNPMPTDPLFGSDVCTHRRLVSTRVDSEKVETILVMDRLCRLGKNLSIVTATPVLGAGRLTFDSLCLTRLAYFQLILYGSDLSVNSAMTCGLGVNRSQGK